MSDISQTAWIWVAKSAGAAAGSAISVAYVLPQGRREAGIRFAVGLVFGLVFGGMAGVKIAAELGVEDRIGGAEVALVGAAAASLCAWWALGLVMRLFRRMGERLK
ncbi:MAG: DUF6107 family protein [Rhizobiaceae bacterium]|nr:DUF6107 family protein [Rhizobiaceae bacterium]MCV0405487.1 DUF6107 family protein [Rhizobiaceae bacterium]